MKRTLEALQLTARRWHRCASNSVFSGLVPKQASSASQPATNSISAAAAGPARLKPGPFPQETLAPKPKFDLQAQRNVLLVVVGGLGVTVATQSAALDAGWDAVLEKYGELFPGRSRSSCQAGAAPLAQPTPDPRSIGVGLGPHFIANAAAKAAPAVVNIAVPTNGLPYSSRPSGSGFILTSDGVIATNAHVVADALAKQVSRPGPPRPIMVALQDGRVFEGRVLSHDSISDLAIVKIDSDQALPTVKLGSSQQLRVGEWVIALGSPLHLQNSVTAGIISCVDRKAVELGLASARTDYIQTDAAVNSGNSGGPLINLDGEVVGISSMKALSADGVSFAIPVDTAKDVMEQLLRLGRVVRPYIGIKMLQLNASNAAQLRKRDPAFPNVSSGILVPHVAMGSPAEKAGLRPGDVIVEVAGSKEITTSSLIRQLGQHVGKSLEVAVMRPGDQRAVLSVTASEVSQ
ncbi:hypothetical protein WJX72_001610 [[Myrmecia] bisecta]|uniref:PDZ domain-containing protein n=1 Tax=[Myrmecia] bisecta TaxID=41462 RepID=A0AAW1Q3W0_9CHLO